MFSCLLLFSQPSTLRSGSRACGPGMENLPLRNPMMGPENIQTGTPEVLQLLGWPHRQSPLQAVLQCKYILIISFTLVCRCWFWIFWITITNVAVTEWFCKWCTYLSIQMLVLNILNNYYQCSCNWMVLTKCVKPFYVATTKLLLHSCKYLPEVFLDICLPFVFAYFSLSQLLPHLQPLLLPAPPPLPPHLPPLPLPQLPLCLLPLPPCLHTFPQTSIQRTNLLSQDPWVNREFIAPLLYLSASPLQQPGGSLEAPVLSQSSWTGCVNRVTTVPRSLTG